MKNIATLLILLLSGMAVKAQGEFFAMDKNLSLSFPKNPDSGKVAGIVVYYLSTKEASFVASYHEKRAFHISGKDHFYRILNAYASGLFAVVNSQNFREEMTDTIMGGVPGKFLRAYEPQDSSRMREMQCFITIQEGHIYSVQVMVNSGHQLDLNEIVGKFFGSLQFRGTPFIPAVEVKPAPVRTKKRAIATIRPQQVAAVEPAPAPDSTQRSKRRGR